MARSFRYSEPDFRQAPYQMRQLGQNSKYSRPNQAFAYNPPTNFNISASSGAGIADAAGLSTLPSAFDSISQRTNYDETGAGLYASEQAEDRAFFRGAGDIISRATRNKYALEAQKSLNKANDKANTSNTFGAIASAGLQTALQVGLPIVLGSDRDIKHTIDELDDAMYLLRELRPVTFFYKEEYSSSPERMHYGFIAQEYQKVMPDQTYYDESIGKLCIDPVELIGVLVRAIQQLDTKITRLEAKAALAGVK